MDIQDHLPLSETAFLILLSLAPQPKHGYAIMKNVEQLSEKRVIMSTGTLYGALKRMLDQGWIERVNQVEQNGRGQKAYTLTRLGKMILEAEIDRMDQLVSAARMRPAKGRS